MKVQISLVDDNGKAFEGSVELTPIKVSTSRRRTNIPRSPSDIQRSIETIDYSLSCRAFITRFVKKTTSGSKKFVILLAWIVKGKTSEKVKTKEIEKQWNSVKGPMKGKYQRIHSTRAKDSGWVDTTDDGLIHLQSTWKNAFG